MSDTRAAEERIVNAPTIYTGYYPREEDGYWGGDPNDAVKVAKAYLEIVPADDGEPLDWDFLASIGFVDDDELNAAYIYLPELRDKMPAIIVDYESGNWSIGDLPIVTPQNRGEARRLLAALGVTP